MKNMIIGLICTAIITSCGSSDSSNNSTAGAGKGGGVLDLNQPRSNRQFPTAADGIINWQLSLIGNRGSARFWGKTSDNLPCVLTLTDSRQSSSIQNLVYLSLGTGATPVAVEDKFTWIGTFIGPYLEYHELSITSKKVSFSLTQTELDPNLEIWNKLVVDLNSNSQPVKVMGQSSHWPSSTCILN